MKKSLDVHQKIFHFVYYKLEGEDEVEGSDEWAREDRRLQLKLKSFIWKLEMIVLKLNSTFKLDTTELINGYWNKCEYRWGFSYDYKNLQSIDQDY
jgi:hypothetical protein